MAFYDCVRTLVIYDGASSNICYIACWIPQESILGHLLIIAHINIIIISTASLARFSTSVTLLINLSSMESNLSLRLDRVERDSMIS